MQRKDDGVLTSRRERIPNKSSAQVMYPPADPGVSRRIASGISPPDFLKRGSCIFEINIFASVGLTKAAIAYQRRGQNEQKALWIIRCGFPCGFSAFRQAQEPKTTVLNPLGQPPAIARVPMAPHLTNLEGKTIYIVDVGFTDTHQFLTEIQKLLGDRYPKTTWIVRTKTGTYFEDDPKLWAEIKEKGNRMIMGVGH